MFSMYDLSKRENYFRVHLAPAGKPFTNSVVFAQGPEPSAGSQSTAHPSTTQMTSSAVITRAWHPSLLKSGLQDNPAAATALLASQMLKEDHRWQATSLQLLGRQMLVIHPQTSRGRSAKTQASLALTSSYAQLLGRHMLMMHSSTSKERSAKIQVSLESDLELRTALGEAYVKYISPNIQTSTGLSAKTQASLGLPRHICKQHQCLPYDHMWLDREVVAGKLHSLTG